MGDSSGGWSQDPLDGKEKPLYNIQASEKQKTEGALQDANLSLVNKKTWIRPFLEKHGWMKLSSTCTRKMGRKCMEKA